MLKTEIKTGGFGGGFTNARIMRPRCRATAVIPRDYNSRCRVDAKKRCTARCCSTERACQKGLTNLTEDSIARMPRWQRWALYAFAALTLTGILPMAAAALLGWLCDLVGWWLLIPLYIVVGRVLWRVDLVMKAEVYRDNAGFWMARIEGRREHAGKPGHRQGLPPPDATRRTIGEQGGSRSGLAPRHEP